MHFRKRGDIEYGHAHQFDHLTLLAKGSLNVKIDDKVTKFVAPNMIFIRKDVEHELVALENDTIAYCIHPLRDGVRVEDILDPTMIPEGKTGFEVTNIQRL